jgi:(p)ppGpp synthase/HD superfamily hydrolase
MEDSRRVASALKFATQKHKGQKRIGGEDYITHPIAVCEMVKAQGYGEDFQIAALFHDLLEDTDVTENEILQYGNQDVLAAVLLLTKKKGCDMAQYIGGIKGNEIAFVVKSADRLHNLQSAMAVGPDFKRKYILETVNWYLDFSLDIKKAVKQLAESLDEPMKDAAFLYTPIESWNAKK